MAVSLGRRAPQVAFATTSEEPHPTGPKAIFQVLKKNGKEANATFVEAHMELRAWTSATTQEALVQM